ncbi:MAG: PDZ domain-containing protein [Planctomycetes bacterium]|nr:PDZ domain-containing protein [Planctomycetota bacterium]
MTRYLIPVFALALIGAGLLHADEKAEKLRDLHAKFSDRVVVLTWTSTTSAMGQTIESNGSTTGLLVGKGGLVVVSNQPLSNRVGGMASMFGRGESTGPEDFKLHTADGKEFSATEALQSDEENLRWYGAKLGKAAGEPLSFPESADVPALGEEVVVIGAADETLNYARFFRTARINCVVEEGKYYGLDGSLADCLGAIVVTLDGKVLGVVGQKKGKEAPGGGGIGRMLGGLNDPSKALGNRVLMTAGVFGDALKEAQKKVREPGFGKDGEATEKTPEDQTTAPPTEEGAFEGSVLSAAYREKQQDLYVRIEIKAGEAPAMDSKVTILDSNGKKVAELTVTRRYNQNPMDPNSPIEEIGGFLPDPEKKLNINKGMKVVVPGVSEPGQPKDDLPPLGFRGINRFTKMGADVLKDNYGDIKVGYSVSQIPDKGSACREAGVKSGDVIYQVGDTKITDETGLQDFLKMLREADGDVKLHIVRKGGEKVEITVPAK